MTAIQRQLYQLKCEMDADTDRLISNIDRPDFLIAKQKVAAYASRLEKLNTWSGKWYDQPGYGPAEASYESLVRFNHPNRKSTLTAAQGNDRDILDDIADLSRFILLTTFAVSALKKWITGS